MGLPVGCSSFMHTKSCLSFHTLVGEQGELGSELRVSLTASSDTSARASPALLRSVKEEERGELDEAASERVVSLRGARMGRCRVRGRREGKQHWGGR